MSYKIFIDGAHGTTGIEIAERLSERKGFEIVDIPDDVRKNIDAKREAAKKADITVLCLPDEAAREMAEALPNDVRVIDTSTANRVTEGWVYGLPEIGEGRRALIRNASKVANPGCHATGFILLARPLVDRGMVSKDAQLSCFSLTGYSGGGKDMIEEFDECHQKQKVLSPFQYSLSQQHKHLPEMCKYSGLDNAPTFCPVVGDFYSGMAVTIELTEDMIQGTHDLEEIREMYKAYYQGESLIDVMDKKKDTGKISSDALSGTDRAEILVEGNDERKVLIARFDNLGKGASGAAIQNMNIMLGLPETDGLRL